MSLFYITHVRSVRNGRYAFELLTDDLIPKTRRCRNNHSMAFQLQSASIEAYKCISPGTGLTSLTLCFRVNR